MTCNTLRTPQTIHSLPLHPGCLHLCFIPHNQTCISISLAPLNIALRDSRGGSNSTNRAVRGLGFNKQGQWLLMFSNQGVGGIRRARGQILQIGGPGA